MYSFFFENVSEKFVLNGLRDTKKLLTKVSSISAQCAIMCNRGVLQSTKNQFTKVSSVRG